MDRIVEFQNALAWSHVPLLQRLHARPEVDHQGQPVIAIGRESLVARVRRADGATLALRVPAAPGAGQDWPVRYAALGSMPSSLVSRFPAGIEVHPHGFEFDDGAVPAITMEWIDGPTLIAAVDRACRGGHTAVLQALAARIHDLAREFRSSGFVHGDITAHNLVIRTSGEVACVDLDTASWSGSPLGPTGRGTPGYHHPAGGESPAARDLFAFMVVYVSLRVLADDPDLRRSYGDPITATDGVLLFTDWDLGDPSTSHCFGDVRERATGEVRTLLDALWFASTGAPSEIGEAASRMFGLDPANLVDEQKTQEVRGWNLADAVNRVRSRYGDEGGAQEPPASMMDTWETWETARSPISDRSPVADTGAEPPLPESPLPVAVTQAAETERSRLRSAIAANDEAQVVHLWHQLEDDPVAKTMALDVEAVLATGYRRRIADESRRHHDEVVISLAEEAAARRIPLDPESRKIVRHVKERIDVRGRLDRALAAGEREALAELAVSGELVVLGDTDRATLRRVLRAIEWPVLQRALETDDDRIIVEVYDAELFDAAEALREPVRRRVELARDRTRWQEEVRVALKRRRVRDIAVLFGEAPDGAEERLSATERRRCRQLIEQQRALDQLSVAVKDQDDAAIVSALNVVERVGARISDRFAWGAIRAVVERVSIVDDLIEAANATPMEHGQLAHLIPVAKALGLSADPRLHGELSLDRLEQRVIQAAHVRRLRIALAKDDDASIVVAAVPDPYDALDQLTEEERDRVARAIRSRRRADPQSVTRLLDR